jgi:hypothetical protein
MEKNSKTRIYDLQLFKKNLWMSIASSPLAMEELTVKAGRSRRFVSVLYLNI